MFTQISITWRLPNGRWTESNKWYSTYQIYWIENLPKAKYKPPKNSRKIKGPCRIIIRRWRIPRSLNRIDSQRNLWTAVDKIYICERWLVNIICRWRGKNIKSLFSIGSILYKNWSNFWITRTRKSFQWKCWH